jgi:hypothetical protein
MGQKITTSEDPSCLVGSAASAPALALSEPAAGCSSELLEHPNENLSKRPFLSAVDKANRMRAF